MSKFFARCSLPKREHILPIALLLTVHSFARQLPPAQKLSAEDDQAFHQELGRLEKLLLTANDPAAVEFQIAKTYAAGGQYTSAIERLGKIVDARLGFDPTRDPDFAKIQNTTEFQSLQRKVRDQTPPVSNSRKIATLYQPDLFPENLAFDPEQGLFFLGSTARNEIAHCSREGDCAPLVKPDRGDQRYVLGLKIDRSAKTIWATENTAAGASLREYDMKTGRLMQTAALAGRHVFNDLAISSAGMVYVTDTSEGSIYQLAKRSHELVRLDPENAFIAANGIALSPDEKVLYISVWGDGIDAVDLPSGRVTPLAHPPDIALSYVDGLYAARSSLIAIQNGPMLPRIVLFRLNGAGRAIVSMKILERRNPLFDGITTGALVGDELYYIANPQIDKKSAQAASHAQLNPLQTLAVPIGK